MFQKSGHEVRLGDRDVGGHFCISVILSAISLIITWVYFSDPYLQTTGSMNWPFILGSWALTVYSYYRARLELDEKNKRSAAESSYDRTRYEVPPVRSQWERDLAAYVREQPGCSGARMNDRSVIVASDGVTPLEIDIYIPELRLGIEADGIKWHDRDAYRRDRLNGTEYSEEMYKERYCARRGIRLIHVWDEDGQDEVRRQIDDAIRAQRNRSY